jgi:hypothetical protein
MSVLQFFRTREWIFIRRLVLIGLVVFLGIRTWGSYLLTPFQSANASRDIAITKSEFRPDVPGSKPAWIIGVRNNSGRFGYEEIQLEATYLDKTGAVLQMDSMTLHQKLVPGQEEVIGSTDIHERPGATNGRLKIVSAKTLK